MKNKLAALAIACVVGIVTYCTIAHSATLTQAELDSLNKGQAITLSPPAPVTPPPSGGGSFTLPSGSVGVYVNGNFMWPGDWSWNGGLITVTYNDTSGVPLDGPDDVKISTTGSWNGWQPYATGTPPSLPIGALKYLNYSIKITKAGTNFTSAWQANCPTCANGEAPTGVGAVLPSTFCSAFVVGKWSTCKIPLGAGGYNIPAGTNLRKFMIQDQSQLSPNIWYVDRVYLSVN